MVKLISNSLTIEENTLDTPHLVSVRHGDFSITSVRNPFARLVSFYEFIKTLSLDSLFLDEYPIRYSNFKDWLLLGNDWVRGSKVKGYRPVQKQSQKIYVDGMDFVVRIEDFTNDTKKLADKLNFKQKNYVENINPHPHYSKYYDSKSIAWVLKYFKWEIDTFNYKFEDMKCL